MDSRVAALFRYPVKSLQGEPVDAAALESDGMRGDRRWGIRDEKTGRILTARRAPELLFGAAADDGGVPRITLPDGRTCHGPGSDTDATLSDWLGRPVRLVRSADIPAGRAEFFADATDDASEALEWTMPQGRFVDALPLLVLTTASLRTGASLHPDGHWDVRRFRPNLLLDVPGDGWVEDAWCEGGKLAIGDSAMLTPREGCARCTMVTRPQPGLADDRDVFRTLARHHGGNFGVWSEIATAGTVAVGDPVRLR
jgi:uncharacterized protein YcbX